MAVPYLLEVAMKTRRSLLVLAVTGLLVSWFELRPSRIEGLDIDIPSDFPLFWILAIAIFYHLARFILFASRDVQVYLRDRVQGLQQEKSEKFMNLQTSGLIALVKMRKQFPQRKYQSFSVRVEFAIEVILPIVLGLVSVVFLIIRV